MKTKKKSPSPEAKAAADRAIRAYFKGLVCEAEARAKFVDLIKNWK